MGTQLDLFAPQIEWKVGDLVNCDYKMGFDFLLSKERLFTGSNWGFILELTKYKTHAIVHFPAQKDPQLKHCVDHWFEFKVIDLQRVTNWGFDEKAFREMYSPLEIPNKQCTNCGMFVYHLNNSICDDCIPLVEWHANRIKK